MAFSKGVSFKMFPSADALRRLIGSRQAKLADMRVPYKKVSIFFDQWVQQNFRSQGGKVGGWAPFAPSTLLRIQKYDSGRAPPALLQDSGRLRQSFKPFHTEKNAGIGSDIPYSKYHEQGTSRLPQRRMLMRRHEVMADTRRILQQHVKEAAK